MKNELRNRPDRPAAYSRAGLVLSAPFDTLLAEHTPPDCGAPRSESFRFAFDNFPTSGGGCIVELGTIRSFVHGGLPGCNEDDPRFWAPDDPESWDWGAGCFSLMAAISLEHVDPEIHTVDIAASHIARCRIVTARYAQFFQYHVSDSVAFLQSLPPRSIDLLYLDTGDVWPIEPSAQHQLREAAALCERSLLRPGGLVLIDDVLSPVPREHGSTVELGKAAYSVPYLTRHGFRVVFDGYQVALTPP